jgi:hypothetical protein
MRRGHALLLVLVLSAATLTAFAIFAARLTQRTERRRAEAVRVQALWLARSALSSGAAGSREVDTPAGRMTVTVSHQGGKTEANVTALHAEALVSREGETWLERYDAR